VVKLDNQSMLGSVRELLSLMDNKQRGQLWRLQILVVLMAFAEVGGVLAIGPFMGLASNLGQLQGDGLLAEIFHLSGFSSPEQFLFWAGVLVFCVLVVASLISIYTTWRLFMYGARVGSELGNRLYRYYLHQSWLFHAAGSSSQLTNHIAQECHRLTVNVVRPLLLMNAKIFLATFMSLAIFIYRPLVAVVGIAIFILAYFLLYKTIRRILVRNGREITSAQTMRFKLMGEGFGGIKDVLLLGRQAVFVERFDQASNRFARAFGITQALSQAPRYAMELIAYGSIIMLVLYLLAVSEGDISDVIPVLAVFGLAGFKLLPAFQQIYTSVTQIKGNLAAFETIKEELKASVEDTAQLVRNDVNKHQVLHPRESIVFDQVHFSYGSQTKALNGLSMTIQVNQTIGIVGSSGSGKSTAIDILLGLIKPDNGELRIDGERISKKNLRQWQKAVGFVSQSIFLADSSIKENIAFGLPPEEIDDQRVRQVATMAHLDEMLKELPEGLDTRVGERGVQLSGGQRQRIGIARALYDDADVLVLDEATSALDGITERFIMEAIKDFSGKKTVVIIAHRLTTVRNCDCIYFMDGGQVIDSGRYEELIKKNKTFMKMAGQA